MTAAGQIREHMEVVSADDHHVVKVDHVLGNEIELAKMDLQSGGHHHRIPMSWVERVDDKVHLNLTRDMAKERWQKMQ
jgi:hypothetical protein